MVVLERDMSKNYKVTIIQSHPNPSTLSTRTNSIVKLNIFYPTSNAIYSIWCV